MSGSADLADLLGGAVHEVAPLLLGSVLSHAGVSVRLTEVEAYGGADDPGSHAFRGRTRRNAVMFGPPGHLYVYFTYGMHHCANVVCGPDGEASAVLLRAGEVVSGHDVARDRRPGSSDRDLARGPARLCRALAIDLSVDGSSLAHGDGRARARRHARTGNRLHRTARGAAGGSRPPLALLAVGGAERVRLPPRGRPDPAAGR